MWSGQGYAVRVGQGYCVVSTRLLLCGEDKVRTRLQCG